MNPDTIKTTSAQPSYSGTSTSHKNNGTPKSRAMLRMFGRVSMRSVTTIGRSATHPSPVRFWWAARRSPPKTLTPAQALTSVAHSRLDRELPTAGRSRGAWRRPRSASRGRSCHREATCPGRSRPVQRAVGDGTVRRRRHGSATGCLGSPAERRAAAGRLARAGVFDWPPLAAGHTHPRAATPNPPPADPSLIEPGRHHLRRRARPTTPRPRRRCASTRSGAAG